MLEQSSTPRSIVRGVAVLAALYLTGGLVWLLPTPGFRMSRLILFIVVIGFAWIGAFGVISDRSLVAFVGATGLFVLGFWQAVLWIFMLPTAAILFGASLLLQQTSETNTAPESR